MEVRDRRVANFRILEIAGRMTVGAEELACRSALDRILADGSDRVILDLRGLTFLDSTCLGIILGTHVRLRNRGGTLRLVGVPERILEMLRTARLLEVLEVFGSEAEAVRAPEESGGRILS